MLSLLLSSIRVFIRYPSMPLARSLVLLSSLVAALALASDPSLAAKPQARPLDAAQAALASNSPDVAFLAARDAFRANDLDRAAQLAQRVTALDPQYPLAAYLDYWALTRRIRDYGDALTDGSPIDAVNAFIARNKGSVVADLARRDWLLALGKRGVWSTFETEMPLFALNDDAQVTCFDLTARALRQIRGVTPTPRITSEAPPDKPEPQANPATIDELVKSAQASIAQPRDYANDIGGCQVLARVLVAEKRISPNDVWRWIRLASDANLPSAAKRYALLLSDAERGSDPATFGKQIDAIFDKPVAWLARGDGVGEGPSGARWKRELTVIALARIARADPAQGAMALARKPDSVTTGERAYLAAQIAAAYAKKQMPDANEWSRQSLEAGQLSEDILGWQVRGALRAEDWKLVEALIEKMPAEMKRPQAADGTWAYWLGRAYKAQKKNEAAAAQFNKVLDQFGFYGQLALEETGQKITLPSRAPPVTEVEVADVKKRAGFLRALAFYQLDLRREGNLEWNFTIRGMSDRELLASAEFATRSLLLDRAVNTADRTRNEHDFAFRFLTPFKPQMQEKAAAVGLDLDWVYGLIRQESRFVQVARSSVGASGLMQLMPATARYVAKKIGMNDYQAGGVTDLDTNLTLGTSYMRMILDDLDSMPVLATAAYNAGPGRPRAWRATLTKPVEGAIFAETIPFNETRDYVKKVMSNATYYAVLLTGTPQSLKARMGYVAQQGYVPSQLP